MGPLQALASRPATRGTHWKDLMFSLSLIGMVIALVMYAISVSPSLLARSWWWQAAVSGVLMALGYAWGVLLEQLGARVLQVTGLRVEASPSTVILFQYGAVGLFLIWFFRAIFKSYRESHSAAALVEMPALGPRGHLLAVAGALVIADLLAGLLAAFVWIGRRLVAFLDQWLPFYVAVIVAAGLVALLVFLLTSRVLVGGLVRLFTRHALKMNTRTAKGIYQPTQPERSGSEQSLCSWQSVGGQGRVFLGRGPRRADIEAVTGRRATEPIRAYAGMPDDPSGLAERAALVVEELRRTGAFERPIIAVTTSTGSGWVDEWQVQPLEYLTGGNCATASMQYSYVPSSINVITGLDAAVSASQLLLRAVREAIDELPEGHPRPSVYVCGESLGAFASQEAFTDLDDVLSSVDGAMWVGTPSFTPLHSALTRNRHRGSPEVAPVYDNARHVRFANIPSDLDSDVFGRELGTWSYPRVVYVQHPSDPVVWWVPSMAWVQPDWMRERAGRDVTRNMEFTRIVSFIQVLADMPVAGTAPPGHGHAYHEELIAMWEGLLGLHDPARPNDLPEGAWVDEDMRERISRAIYANIALSERQ